jgi:hypothetical protein
LTADASHGAFARKEKSEASFALSIRGHRSYFFFFLVVLAAFLVFFAAFFFAAIFTHLHPTEQMG